MAGRCRTSFPEPEEELGITHECRGWQCCALCRSSRLGVATLRRARERQVAWRETNTPLHKNPVPDPVPFTSLDDAFDSLLQYMSTASRKCRNYHCCHDDHSPRGSHAHRHRVRYHDSSTLHPGDHRDKLSCSPPPRVVLKALPGGYVVTAARWGPQTTPTTRVVNLDPEKYVTLTMTV